VHAVGHLVRELHAHFFEPGRLEALDVLALGESAGDAADVGAALRPILGRKTVLGDDVADADPAARPEHARDLGQHCRLVDRQVDHAVRDHDVDRVGRQRDLLHDPFQEVHVHHARLVRILAGERKHLIRHVQSVRGSCRADPLGRQNHVDAAPRA